MNSSLEKHPEGLRSSVTPSRKWLRAAVVLAAILAIAALPQIGDDVAEPMFVAVAIIGLVVMAGCPKAWPNVGDGGARWLVQFFALLGMFWTLALYVPFGRWLSRPILLPAAVGNADAILVLASGFYPEGDPCYAGLQRVLHGAKLLREGRAPRLVISTSGIVDERTGHREADWVASIATLLQLRPTEFQIVREGMTTRHESEVFARILHPQGIRTILLVTNGPHIRRATRVFTKAGFNVLPAPVQTAASIDSACDSSLALFNYAMHEWIGLSLYRLRGDIDEF